MVFDKKYSIVMFELQEKTITTSSKTLFKLFTERLDIKNSKTKKKKRKKIKIPGPCSVSEAFLHMIEK